MEHEFEFTHGFELRANDIPDLSQVTSMAYMFSNPYVVFNAMIKNWDVSNVTNMEGMFNYSPFN